MSISEQKTVFIENGNATLHLKIYSNDILETLILLHGGPGVPDDMIEVVEFLKKNYHIITFEQRGVGQSKCEECTYKMENYISDIDAISQYLEIDKFHLFGHSWGGLYAQIYAEERPEKIKSLFLCSPSSGTNKTWQKTEKEVMRFNQKSTSKIEWLQMGWNSLLGMLGSDKAYQKLFNQVLKNYHKDYFEVKIEKDFLKKIYAKSVNKTTKEIKNYKALPVFNNTNYPILITYGDNDIYGNSRNKLLERFPSAKVHIIRKCGHIPWKHNPDGFNKVLIEFYFSKKNYN
ncbi:alpha/beta fold hydrolase [Winogradskyella endarachnes]|uniref:Alpha/beta fold hydrolase n=1 Tax=Winogradskyella endarachnes TaxID=2681965 RepID=A0A6L6U9G9_9FLAO|nr:alpha/beta hydrolase [Winogradskyella endarachnes]MUU78679.1 alpha/beta fold hydrolase [Winogradskyella endarachnes]